MNESKRRKAAVRAAEERSTPALLITHPADVRYLTGFTGSNAAVVLDRARPVLFTDGRYKTQAAQQSPGVRIVVEQKPAPVAAVEYITTRNHTSCGYDPDNTTVSAFDRLRRALPSKTRRSFFHPLPGLIAGLREIKDADEISRMRRAAKLGCTLFDVALEHLTPGATEASVAAAMEFAARQAGASAMSFDTIIASGKRSALPHGVASSARLPRKGFVTLDFGVLLDGYCSDMTRTVHLGIASRRHREVYDSVLEAQQAAVAIVRSGVTSGEVDEAARSVLRQAGLGKYFSHSTGHGVGLEIHEGPRIASKQKQVLEPGMVITIEPGVYLPGEFGIRIEDMVLVTATGGEVLTSLSPKHWIEVE
ncbi:MAG: Xaa-Pro peptidase family protein [Bryocella sp.]